MSDSFHVKPEHLSLTASQFRSTAHDILQLLSTLQTTSGNLSAGWSGKSYAAYQSLWERWRTSILDLADAMDTMASTLDKASAAYVHTDDTAMPKTGPQ